MLDSVPPKGVPYLPGTAVASERGWCDYKMQDNVSLHRVDSLI